MTRKRRLHARLARIEKLTARMVMNAAPIASDDILLLESDQSAQIDYLLLNDSDPEGDVLSVVSTTAPSHGTLTENADGTFQFVPNSGFVGSDSFTYTVGDGLGLTDVGTVSITVNAPIDAEAARDQILAGVTTIADPVQPGRMLVYGSTAISVSNYNSEDLNNPMIAAATMGSGRVVALPDHQWLNFNNYGGVLDTGTLYENSISWLAESTDKTISVVTYNNTANASWLTAQGYTNVTNATASSLATDLVGADVFVAGWLGNGVSNSTLQTVEDYVKDGGGLFIAEYGIGYQWWWNQATEQIPGNRLLRDAGIAFTKVWPSSGVQTIDRASGQMTSDDVLAILSDSTGATQAEKDLAGSIYGQLNAVLGDDDSLQARLDVEFNNRIQSINPTPMTPVTDSFDKAMLQREMDLIGNLPPDQVTAHRTAIDVYGSLGPAAVVGISNQVVSVNTNISGWLTTGMYAVPGEVATVTVPSSLVGQGYSIRISGHQDNISGRSSWDRVPKNVSRTFPIDATSVDIASAFGGAIYIDVGGQAAGNVPSLGNLDVTIDNAIYAPYFVLGQTTDQDWIDTIRNYPGAYAEFVSDGLSFAVPSTWIRDLENPTALMSFWNDTIARMDYVGGFETLRTGPDRINLDVQISVGLLHAGYPMQGPIWYGDSIVDLDRLQSTGDWGWFHELGHEIQRHPELGWGYDNPWTFSGDIEVTVNIAANAALENATTDPGSSGWGWSVYPDQVMSRAVTTVNDSSNPNFEDKNPYPFYFQLADGPWGWDGYRDVLKSYADDQQNNPSAIPDTNQDEKDQWLIRWSEKTGHDMTTYMVNHWGLEVTQSALDTVSAMNFPSWMPLAVSTTSIDLTPGGSETIDWSNAGLSLDGVVPTLISVGNPGSGSITDHGDGTFTYTAAPGFDGTDSFDVTYQSSEGNLQTFAIDVQVFTEGVLLERFDGISGTSLADLTSASNYPASPDATSFTTSFESPTDVDDNYGLRMRAYVTPPVTGDYTFWLASDDNGQLLLSDSTDPAGATEIASVPEWTFSREWDKFSSQQSSTIRLVAGRPYYIEALMKEGGGGDNLAVAWSVPNSPVAAPIVIDGQYLTIFGAAVSEPGLDFGDAPISYPVSAASNGAHHVALGPQLGLARSTEVDSAGSPQADADIDDDGAMFGAIDIASNMAAINVSLHGADTARVDAWIDFDRDGIWSAAEQILDSVPITVSLQTLNYTLPAGLTDGETFARVRVSSAGGLSPTGWAEDGEVEDYRVVLTAAPTVANVELNHGQLTRSALDHVAIEFNQEVELDMVDGSPFDLMNTTTGDLVTVVPTLVSSNDQTTVTLGFLGGPSVTAWGALRNGAYELTIDSSRIHTNGVALDGDGNGAAGGNYVFGDESVDKFFRKYGDTDGDDLVSLLDFAQFRQNFGSSSADADFRDDLDSDGDGNVGLLDFAAFRQTFGS